MKTILVTYIAKDEETLDKFYAELLEERIGELSRKDEGCLKYDYYLSLEKDNQILLVERWESEEALELHRKTGHYAKAKELSAKYDLDKEIIRIVE